MRTANSLIIAMSVFQSVPSYSLQECHDPLRTTLRGAPLPSMANDKFPVDEAQLVTLFMQCIAYGIYLVTLGLCIRALFWGSTGKKDRYNWPLIVVAGFMFVFATLDVAFGLRHNLDAFIFYKGTGGANAEFEDISYWVNVMKVRPLPLTLQCSKKITAVTSQTVDVQIMTLIGDGMLVCRLNSVICAIRLADILLRFIVAL